ncbi:hypothetical protein B0H11DRAFT_2003352 [Mycena galericulata]|nr:hypothetical protein B0H11DRAFT_2003352 [Mycena galericulata]
MFACRLRSLLRLQNGKSFGLSRFSTVPEPPKQPSAKKHRWAQKQLKIGGLAPPKPPSIDPDQRMIIGEKSVRTIEGWNARPIIDKVVFHHVPCSLTSARNRQVIENTFHNRANLLAPWRFILDVQEEIPSPDLFREYLYLAGQASMQMFLLPAAHDQHVPNAFVLHEFVCKNPQYLAAPLIHLTTKQQGSALFVGPGAAEALLDIVKKRETRQVGPALMRLLHMLSRGRDINAKRKGGQRKNLP